MGCLARMLDTLRAVTTPELIEVQIHPAGLLPRSLAWLSDFAIRFVVLSASSQFLLAFGDFGTGLLLLAYFLLEWLYPVFFEVTMGGATPGKRIMRLAVVNEDGTPVGWGPSLSRNLLRTADFLPFAYCLGIISMLLDKDFRRLGDIVAGTLVVYREPSLRLPDIIPAEPLAPQQTLDRATQRALIAFAERAPGLTSARQEELADLVPCLAIGASGPQGAQRLLGLANYLIGRRA